MVIPDETRKLIAALSLAVDGSKGIPVDADERVLDAQGLAMKCLFHASSCLSLYGGTVLTSADTRVLDTPSMNVLARAAVESSLTFHHLFVAPRDPSLREFRHLSWLLGDLLERQAFRATTPEHKQQLADEAGQIQALQARLRANPELGKLSVKQQGQLLTKNKWRWPGWTDIALDAGMSVLHADQLYRYLCSFAHSGSLSVLQLRQPKTTNDKRALGEGALQTVNVALAFMIRGYSTVFTGAATAVATDSVLSSAVDLWYGLGSGDERRVEQGDEADER